MSFPPGGPMAETLGGPPEGLIREEIGFSRGQRIMPPPGATVMLPPGKGIMETLPPESPNYPDHFAPYLRNVRVTYGLWDTRYGMSLWYTLPGTGNTLYLRSLYRSDAARIRLAARGGVLYKLREGADTSFQTVVVSGSMSTTAIYSGATTDQDLHFYTDRTNPLLVYDMNAETAATVKVVAAPTVAPVCTPQTFRFLESWRASTPYGWIASDGSISLSGTSRTAPGGLEPVVNFTIPQDDDGQRWDKNVVKEPVPSHTMLVEAKTNIANGELTFHAGQSGNQFHGPLWNSTINVWKAKIIQLGLIDYINYRSIRVGQVANGPYTTYLSRMALPGYLEGQYQWAYTHYDPGSGAESGPSPAFAFDFTTGTVDDLTHSCAIGVTSDSGTDASTTKIRIYRSGGVPSLTTDANGQTLYYLVGEIYDLSTYLTAAAAAGARTLTLNAITSLAGFDATTNISGGDFLRLDPGTSVEETVQIKWITQKGQPTTDITTQAGWARVTHGSTTLSDNIGEDLRDDSDYLRFTAGTVGNFFETQLSTVSTPGTGTVSYQFSCRGNDNTAMKMKCDLVEGTTVRHAGTAQTVPNSDSFTVLTETLTSGEVAAVTNWADVRLRFYADTLSAGKRIDVSWAQLDTPQPTSNPILTLWDPIQNAHDVGSASNKNVQYGFVDNVANEVVDTSQQPLDIHRDGPPKAVQWVAVAPDGRLWLFGWTDTDDSTAHPGGIAISNKATLDRIKDFEVFPKGVDPLTTGDLLQGWRFDLPGETITWGGFHQGIATVFTTNAMYQIYAYSQADWGPSACIKLHSTGCLAGATVQEIDGILYWVAPGNPGPMVMQWAGGRQEPKPVSYLRISDTLRNSPSGYRSGWFAVIHRSDVGTYYRLFMTPSGATTNTLRLEYNIHADAWESASHVNSAGATLAWAVADVANGGTDLSPLYAATQTGGTLFQLEDSTVSTDNAVAIPVSFTTRRYPLGEIMKAERLFVRSARTLGTCDQLCVTPTLGGSEYGDTSDIYDLELAGDGDAEIYERMDFGRLKGTWGSIHAEGDVSHRPSIRQIELYTSFCRETERRISR